MHYKNAPNFSTSSNRVKEQNQGFTLIELSIVLVVIGLIIGGILVGQNLISAAKRLKLISEMIKLQVAINTFQVKYNCGLPGDCLQAILFLGPTAPNGVSIVNGNGDGFIDQFPGGYSGHPLYSEAWQFPVQLSASGLIAGAYSGAAGPLSDYGSYRQAIPGTNVPASNAYPGVGFMFLNFGNWSSGSSGFTPDVNAKLNNVLLVGKPDNITGLGQQFETYAPFLTPVEAMQIDQKIDDGMPASGRITDSGPGLFPGCVTSLNPAIALYNTASNNITCNFIYNLP